MLQHRSLMDYSILFTISPTHYNHIFGFINWCTCATILELDGLFFFTCATTNTGEHWRWTALFTWCFTCATTNTGDGLLFLHDVSLVQQQTVELVGNCMAYSLLLPILIRLHFKAICTSTTSPHIAWARFLVYRHRTWEGNTGYTLSCRPVNYTYVCNLG